MQAPHARTAGDKIEYAEHIGTLLYITVKGVQRDIQTVHGPSDAVNCDIALLDGPRKGQTLNDVLVFPRVLQGQLSASAGAADPVVVARLGQGAAKSGKSAPWILNDPTADDMAVATKYEAYAKEQAAKQEEPF